jgi:hypothetical protein
MKIDPANRDATETEAAETEDEQDATATVVADGAPEAGVGPAADEAAEAPEQEADEAPEQEADEAHEPEADGSDDGADVESAVEPLTISLPDGSESVSEAILSHRQMLANPSKHGLVSETEAAEMLDAVETLSEEVPEGLESELETLETSIEAMADRLDRQDRQLAELRETVTSLAEILGTSVEFETADEA